MCVSAHACSMCINFRRWVRVSVGVVQVHAWIPYQVVVRGVRHGAAWSGLAVHVPARAQAAAKLAAALYGALDKLS